MRLLLGYAGLKEKFMNKARFQIAKKDITSVFENSRPPIFTYTEISKILKENREHWRLQENLTAQKFIELLIKHANLKRYELNFLSRKILKFTWGEVSNFQFALSLMENSYLTHYTALYLHNLTDQIPKTIYVNFEQIKRKVAKNELIQSNVDRAFSRPQRTAKAIAPYRKSNICLLNGKSTNQLVVIDMTISENEKLRVTNIERTLIDITVRPSYAGGAYQVLDAYKKSKDQVSINKLSAMLKKLDYIYPYYQAIGFYLEKSGVYEESQIELLRNFEFKIDFYLIHNMKETKYSKKWRLYYPKGF